MVSYDTDYQRAVVKSYTREGDFIIERRTDSMQITRYYLGCHIHRYTSSTTFPKLSFSLNYDLVQVPVGSDYQHYGGIRWRTVKVPDHPDIPIPAAVLMYHPDITVEMTYIYVRNKLNLSNVYLKHKGKPYYTPQYPTYMIFQGAMPVGFAFANEHGYHHDTSHSRLLLSASVSRAYHELQYSEHHTSFAQYITTLYLAWNMVGCTGEEYHHNGLKIPNELVDSGVIDISKFDPIIDAFTVDMCK